MMCRAVGSAPIFIPQLHGELSVRSVPGAGNAGPNTTGPCLPRSPGYGFPIHSIHRNTQRQKISKQASTPDISLEDTIIFMGALTILETIFKRKDIKDSCWITRDNLFNSAEAAF